ncbi:MAG: zinc ribbon domain-containing protein [Actinomycetia bacterium]|nr:zinc ribbon domain-containing protein [Actinomycetes bacterium]
MGRQSLTLDQAYQAAYLWLDHAGDPPVQISEPAHGSVELVTEKSFVRVRSSDGPVEQSSVLALLRAAEAGKKLIIFSPSGFSPGAISIAETQGIALFALEQNGRAVSQTTHARVMSPDTEPLPPFGPMEPEEPKDTFWNPQPSEEPQRRTGEADEDGIDAGTFDWADCPSCGTTHHRHAKFCRECGTNLQTGAAGVSSSDSVHVTPVPRDGVTPKLRCRTCGSHDIELLE